MRVKSVEERKRVRRKTERRFLSLDIELFLVEPGDLGVICIIFFFFFLTRESKEMGEEDGQ